MSFNENTGEVTTNLANRFSANETNIQTATDNITLLNQEITAARGTRVHTGGGA